MTTALLQRPSTVVVAGVRDPEHSTSQALSKLPTGQGSRVIIVKIDSQSSTDAAEAVKQLPTQHDISTIDVLLAVSGIAKAYAPATEVPINEVQEHFDVNVLGPLKLFQATWPMLEKSTNPKFVAITTGLASITDMGSMPMPVTAYGTSKAALNYVMRKIHFENEKLIAFPLSPGYDFAVPLWVLC